MGPSAANSAAAEKPQPQVLAPIGPQVPSTCGAVGPRGPWVVPAPSGVGPSHVPAAIAAGLEGRAILVQVPPTLPAVLARAVARRLALQADATTRRQLLGPRAPHKVRLPKDAAPGLPATPCLVAP